MMETSDHPLTDDRPIPERFGLATVRRNSPKTLARPALIKETGKSGTYLYKYDAFGRLVEVSSKTPAAVTRYRYNGLGHRTMWQYDADADEDLTDGERFYFAYDERWRIIQTYRDADAEAKERFVYHAAGAGGFGGSSYIDSVILRDRDNSEKWYVEADGSLETRVYYCQNWRADVVATIGPTATGEGNGLQVLERVKYDSYGRPRVMLIADYDHDGDVDAADNTAFNAEYGGTASAKADINFDGGVNGDDNLTWLAQYGAEQTHNRKLYAGYEWDPALAAGTADAGVYHVRHRVLLSELGRWSRRDPIGYVDGTSLMDYVGSLPLSLADPFGLLAQSILDVEYCSAGPPNGEECVTRGSRDACLSCCICRDRDGELISWGDCATACLGFRFPLRPRRIRIDPRDTRPIRDGGGGYVGVGKLCTDSGPANGKCRVTGCRPKGSNGCDARETDMTIPSPTGGNEFWCVTCSEGCRPAGGVHHRDQLPKFSCVPR
jgi:RHS repeat-associated protein